MTLTLTIENEESLPNGAPTSVRLTEGRGVDIGRSSSVDWPLPDPTRFISGRHCEVRFREGAYWLNDISTNGTFVNDSARRVQAPYLLRDGDKLAIGAYVIAVSIEETAQAPADGAGTVWPSSAGPGAAEPQGAPEPEASPVSAEQAEPEPAAGPDEIARARAAAAQAGRPFTVIRPLGPFPQPVDDVAPAPGKRPQEGRIEDSRIEEGRGEETARPADAPPPGGDTDLWAAPDLWSAEAEAAPADRPNAGTQQDDASPDGAAQDDVTHGDATHDDATHDDAAPQAPLAAGPAQRLEPQLEDAPAARAHEEPEARPAPERDAQAAGQAGADFLRAFAKGAGIPDHIFARKDPLKTAEELGALTRLAVEDLTQLLSARFKAKRFARASSQTMIQALDNNPLKFAPTADDALKIMFGPRTSGYLDARRAFEGAFADLKSHQIYTFAAMQKAVRMLVEDLDPKSIEAAAGDDGRFAALFGGRKGRLWDQFVARWQAKSLRHEDGLVDAFMLYFAECYDQAKDDG